jgi:Spy/CpxP family protein refolding chaperone
VTRSLVLLFVVLISLAFIAPPACGEGSPAAWEGIQRDLGLSSDQMAKIKPLMEAYLSAKRTRIDQLAAHIRALLTPAQQTRFDALRKSYARGDHGSSHHSPMSEMIMKLDLTPAQIDAIKKLVSANIAQARDAHARFLEQLKPLLSDEQYARFQDLTRHHHP